MDNNLTDITLLLDRSGSMQTGKADYEGGIAKFVEEQQKAPGKANLTLALFDDKFETPFAGKPISEVEPIHIVPRGMTRLVDAMGKVIAETGERLSKIPEADRPGLVVFVIVTDGGENDSQEFTSKQVSEMVKHQEETYKWKFIYLGANQDAFGEAGSIGLQQHGTSNYAQTSGGIGAAYASVASNVLRARSQVSKGMTADVSFSTEQRKSMMSGSPDESA